MAEEKSEVYSVPPHVPDLPNGRCFSRLWRTPREPFAPRAPAPKPRARKPSHYEPADGSEPKIFVPLFNLPRANESLSEQKERNLFKFMDVLPAAIQELHRLHELNSSPSPPSGYAWSILYNKLYDWIIYTVKAGTGIDLAPVLTRWMSRPMEWLEDYFENVLPAKLAKANRHAAMSAKAERIQAPLDTLYGQLSAKYIELTDGAIESAPESIPETLDQAEAGDQAKAALECKLKIFEEGLEFLDAQLHRCHQWTDPAAALAKAAADEIQQDLYDGFVGKLVASFIGI